MMASDWYNCSVNTGNNVVKNSEEKLNRLGLPSGQFNTTNLKGYIKQNNKNYVTPIDHKKHLPMVGAQLKGY